MIKSLVATAAAGSRRCSFATTAHDAKTADDVGGRAEPQRGHELSSCLARRALASRGPSRSASCEGAPRRLGLCIGKLKQTASAAKGLSL